MAIKEMHLKKRYWVVVADGAEARIFERAEKFSPLHQIYHLNHTHELTHTHGRDKPGRVFESALYDRHAYEPKTDWHENQKHLFIKHVAEKVCLAYESHEFERLVLVCPAHLMKDFKERVMAQVGEEDIKMVMKDLTHHSLEEVQKCLDEIL
jgi:protein required for attachment to host cells